MSCRVRLRSAASAALAAIAMVAVAPAAFGEDLTLEGCVDIAIKRATTILTEQTQVALRGTEVLQAYGQFLPSVDVNGSYEWQKGKSLSVVQGLYLIDSSSRQTSYGITATLNIFNGLSDFSGLNAALARQKAENLSLEWAKIQIALDVTQTYLQLALDRLLLDIARQNLDASKSRLKLIQGQAAVGAASRPDLFRQQAQTAADAFQVTSLETRAQDDRLLLIRKLRLDPAAPHEFKQPSLGGTRSALADQPIDKLVSDAAAERPDVLSADQRLETTDWSVTQAKSGYLPKLDLALARTAAGLYLTRDNVNGNDVLSFSQSPLLSQLGNQVQYSATLNLTWNLFGRFVTTLDVGCARATRDVAEIARDDARLQLQYDVRTAYANYASAVAQLDSAKVGLNAGEKSYQVTENMYEVGSASIVDVLTAQAALVQARSQEAQALTNLKLQERTLSYSVGKP